MTYTPVLEHEPDGQLIAATDNDSATAHYEDCRELLALIKRDYTVKDRGLKDKLSDFDTNVREAFKTWHDGYKGLPEYSKYVAMIDEFNTALEAGKVTWKHAPAAPKPQPQPQSAQPASTWPVTLDSILEAIQGADGIAPMVKAQAEQIAAVTMVTRRNQGDIVDLTTRVDYLERTQGITPSPRSTITPSARRGRIRRSVFGWLNESSGAHR